MGPIMISCQGATWQDDLSPHLDRLYRYARRCTRHRADSDGDAQEVILWAMETFAREWRAGAEVALWMRHALRRVWNGESWVRQRDTGTTPRMRSVRSTCQVTGRERVDYGRLTDYTPRDLLSDAAQLGGLHRAVADLALQGQSHKRMSRELRIGDRRARRLLAEVADSIGAV